MLEQIDSRNAVTRKSGSSYTWAAIQFSVCTRGISTYFPPPATQACLIWHYARLFMGSLHMAGIKTASGMTLGSLYFDGLRKVLGAIRCCQTAGAVTLTLTPVNK